MTSVSSAFPRSERVYPAIMPLGAISSGDPPWRKASRYVRIGRDDLHVVRTTAIIVASPLAEAQHRIREGRPPRRPYITKANHINPLIWLLKWQKKFR